VAEPPQASRDFYGALQRFQLALVGIGRRLWRQVLPGDLDGSWARVAPQLVAYTAGAQLAAARTAADYVPAVLAETGQRDDPDAQVRPEAFAGTAYDGRPLDTLLEGGIRTAKAKIGTGTDPAEALVGGRQWLETALRTVVTDAARDATAVQIAARGGVGWVRQVNPPCCSRCAVLAGKWFAWNDGFLRHPRCDCVHIPAAENMAGSFVTDPHELWRRGLITDLSLAQEKRLEQDADLVKVLNESRDRWRVRMALQRKAEKEAAKRRGQWGTNEPTPLPPGGIQDFLSHLTSRVEALRELEARGITE
jgi:hypothetical protein